MGSRDMPNLFDIWWGGVLKRFQAPELNPNYESIYYRHSFPTRPHNAPSLSKTYITADHSHLTKELASVMRFLRRAARITRELAQLASLLAITDSYYFRKYFIGQSVLGGQVT